MKLVSKTLALLVIMSAMGAASFAEGKKTELGQMTDEPCKCKGSVLTEPSFKADKSVSTSVKNSSNSKAGKAD